jgi:hypothetical protein
VAVDLDGGLAVGCGGRLVQVRHCAAGHIVALAFIAARVAARPAPP